jgi:hypothetical protein
MVTWGQSATADDLRMGVTEHGEILFGGPSPTEARAAVQGRIQEQSAGAVSLVDFKATGASLGQKDKSPGGLCELGFEAQIEFAGPCRWATGFGGQPLTFKILNPGEEHTNAAAGGIVAIAGKGERYTVFGAVLFAPKTNGWVHRGFASAGPPKKTDDVSAERCVYNLRWISGAFATWALDHEQRYPFNVSTNAGGTKELCASSGSGLDLNSAAHFRVMSNELVKITVLVCPADRSRKAAESFSALGSTNVSYQIRSGAYPGASGPEQPLVVCPIHGYVLYSGGNIETSK